MEIARRSPDSFPRWLTSRFSFQSDDDQLSLRRLSVSRHSDGWLWPTCPANALFHASISLFVRCWWGTVASKTEVQMRLIAAVPPWNGWWATVSKPTREAPFTVLACLISALRGPEPPVQSFCLLMRTCSTTICAVTLKECDGQKTFNCRSLLAMVHRSSFPPVPCSS